MKENYVGYSFGKCMFAFNKWTCYIIKFIFIYIYLSIFMHVCTNTV